MEENKLPSLPDVGNSIFKKHILDEDSVKAKLNEAIQEIVARGQQKRSLSQEQTHQLVTMLSNMKLYTTLCETPVLNATRDFYKKKAAETISTLSFCEYLKAVRFIYQHL